jgi:hypothetical protein
MMCKIFRSSIAVAALLSFASVSFAQQPQTDQPPMPRYAQEHWSEYLDAAPYLVPANPPGKAQIRPFKGERRANSIAPASLFLPHEVWI